MKLGERREGSKKGTQQGCIGRKKKVHWKGNEKLVFTFELNCN
jgi:hypothetical protein